MHGIGLAVRLKNEVKPEGGGERGMNVKKNVLVMKFNKNLNIPYYGEYLSVNTG